MKPSQGATKEPRLPSLTTEELAAIEWLRCHCTVSTGPAFMPDDARQVRSILSAIDKLMASALSETRDSKDAERYRFLKARRGNIVDISWNSFYSDIYSTAKMGNVDAAIDKA